MNIKRNKLDILFSEYIRLRADGKCELCLRRKTFKKLQCSHFHGRRKKSVRWDPENAAGLCFACHRFLTENPVEHVSWFRKRLGQANYDALLLRANAHKKPDTELLILGLGQAIKMLKIENKQKNDVF